jgi:hypothetical protein
MKERDLVKKKKKKTIRFKPWPGLAGARPTFHDHIMGVFGSAFF